MLTHNDSVTIRLSLILNAVVGLLPALGVKGSSHDPMGYASWWPRDYHSGPIVVAVGAVLGAGVLFWLCRRSHWRWWAFALTGVVVGIFPSLVYLSAARGHSEWLPLLLAMLIVGAAWGAIVNMVLYFVLKPKRVRSGA